MVISVDPLVRQIYTCGSPHTNFCLRWVGYAFDSMPFAVPVLAGSLHKTLLGESIWNFKCCLHMFKLKLFQMIYFRSSVVAVRFLTRYVTTLGIRDYRENGWFGLRWMDGGIYLFNRQTELDTFHLTPEPYGSADITNDFVEKSLSIGKVSDTLWNIKWYRLCSVAVKCSGLIV